MFVQGLLGMVRFGMGQLCVAAGLVVATYICL